jgi:drug/metabolite transporter (DMT)-like permease
MDMGDTGWFYAFRRCNNGAFNRSIAIHPASMDPLLLALAFGSAFCFALALVLTQFGLRTLPPMDGARISVPVTALVFLALSPLTVSFSRWQPGSLALFAGAGLIFPVAVTLLTFASNRRIGPNLTGTLGNMTPLFAVGIAALLLGEVPGAGQIAGIAIICGGIVLIFARRRAMPHGIPAWAVLLPLAAALIRGLVQPVVKLGLAGWPDPFAAVTIGYAVSAVVITTAGLVRKGRGAMYPSSPGRRWFMAVGIVNGLAVLTLYTALARGPVTLVAPLVACYPLFTLLLNRIVLGDRSLSLQPVIGIAVTVAGVAVLLVS